MQTRRARSRIEAQGAITDDRDKHFDKCGCRCHVLPAPAPHLQDKCASVSYVSPCSIVAIIITSQSCALTIRAFNGDPRQHLRYMYAWCPVHTTRSRRAGTPRSESVPDTPARGLLAPRTAGMHAHPQCGLTESASESLTHRHAREPPPHPRPSRATPTAASRAPRRAPCCCLSRGPEGGEASAAARSLLVYAARAIASLQRAPRASARRRVSGSINGGLCCGLARVRHGVCACARVCVCACG